MKHPDIMLGVTSSSSMERIFAEEAFRLLGAAAVPRMFRMDGFSITTATTDPIEMLTEGEQEVAFRLNTMPTFEGSQASIFQPDKKYLAISFQYGELSDDDDDMEIVTDEDFTWHDYIVTVINTEDIDDVSVLDAATGRVLSSEDLGRAHFNLQEAGRALREAHYEEEVQRTMLAQVIARLDKGYGEFRSEDHIELSYCSDHKSENIPCEHNPYTLN